MIGQMLMFWLHGVGLFAFYAGKVKRDAFDMKSVESADYHIGTGIIYCNRYIVTRTYLSSGKCN